MDFLLHKLKKYSIQLLGWEEVDKILGQQGLYLANALVVPNNEGVFYVTVVNVNDSEVKIGKINS